MSCVSMSACNVVLSVVTSRLLTDVNTVVSTSHSENGVAPTTRHKEIFSQQKNLLCAVADAEMVIGEMMGSRGEGPNRVHGQSPPPSPPLAESRIPDSQVAIWHAVSHVNVLTVWK